jgi:catechol 2,3-dioxygenase-like lactoylglutathione lyase family enzyme
MLNHTMIGSNDIQRTKAFYDAVLSVLGAGPAMEHVNDTGQTRLFYIHDGSTFGISEPINGGPATVANGGTTSEDPPGAREGSMGTMYLCYFLDPDGHKICGIHRPA